MKEQLDAKVLAEIQKGLRKNRDLLDALAAFIENNRAKLVPNQLRRPTPAEYILGRSLQRLKGKGSIQWGGVKKGWTPT